MALKVCRSALLTMMFNASLSGQLLCSASQGLLVLRSKPGSLRLFSCLEISPGGQAGIPSSNSGLSPRWSVDDTRSRILRTIPHLLGRLRLGDLLSAGLADLSASQAVCQNRAPPLYTLLPQPCVRPCWMVKHDVVTLFVARAVRLFAFGSTGVVLALYLNATGMTDDKIGLLMWITLVGDAGISLLVTMFADRVGRRAMLLFGCSLKLLGGAVLASVHSQVFWLLVLGCTIGVVSPSGNEVGPFLAVEQSALSEQVSPRRRTMIFAWYSFLGSCTSAVGSLFAGFFTTWLVKQENFSELDSYRMVFVEYGAIALLLMVLICTLSERVDKRRTSSSTLPVSMHSSHSQGCLSGRKAPSNSGHSEAEASAYKGNPLAEPLLPGAYAEDDLGDQGPGARGALKHTAWLARDMQERSVSGPLLGTVPSLTQQASAELPLSGSCCQVAAQQLQESNVAPAQGGLPPPLCPAPAQQAGWQEQLSSKLESQPFLLRQSANAVDEPLDSSASNSACSSVASRVSSSSSSTCGAEVEEEEEGARCRPPLLQPFGHNEGDGIVIVYIPETAARAKAHVDEASAATATTAGAAAVTGCQSSFSAGLMASNKATIAAAGGDAPRPAPMGFLGLSRRSRAKVLHLCSLFLLDSFGSGMVTGSLLVLYFAQHWDQSDVKLGAILFGANIIGGLSSLASGWVASKLGLIRCMVFTHLPSSLILMLVPLMPNVELAMTMVFLRYTISQMDVVPRQSYVSGFVPIEERTVTLGITNIVRSLGAACGPLVTGWLAHKGLFGWAFVLSGAIQIVYDLALLWSFSHHKAEHE